VLTEDPALVHWLMASTLLRTQMRRQSSRAMMQTSTVRAVESVVTKEAEKWEEKET
jgi:hypothetical protein